MAEQQRQAEEQPSAVGLLRISKDLSRKGLGVKRQRQDVEKAAAARGLRLAKVFVDNDISGWKVPFRERPGYIATAAELASGQHRYLITFSVDRIGRRSDELIGDTMRLAIRAGVIILACDFYGHVDEYDVRSSRGRVAFRNAAVAAENEVDTMSGRVIDHHAILAAEGRAIGIPPFGYAIEYLPDGSKRRVIVPEEAEAIRWAVEQLLLGKPLRSVLRRWWALGLKTRRAGQQTERAGLDGELLVDEVDGEWSLHSLRRLLRNPALAARRPVYQYVYDPDTRGRRRDLSAPVQLVEAAWEPIISLEQHRAIDRLFHGRSLPGRPDVKSSVPGALVRCGGTRSNGKPCEAAMSSARLAGRRAYACKSHKKRGNCGALSISAIDLERVVGQMIQLRVQAAAEKGLEDPTQAEALRLTEQLAEVEAQLIEQERDYAHGQLTREMYREGREIRMSRRRELQRDLAELSQGDVRQEALRRLVEEGLDTARWEALDIETKRRYAWLFIRRITVRKDQGSGRMPRDPLIRDERITERLQIDWWV